MCVIKQFMVLTRNGLAKQLANFKMVPCDEEEENESNFDDEYPAIKKRRQTLELEKIELEKIELEQLEKRNSIQTQSISIRQAGIDSISNFLALMKSLDNIWILDYDTRQALKELATKQFLASA